MTRPRYRRWLTYRPRPRPTLEQLFLLACLVVILTAFLMTVFRFAGRTKHWPVLELSPAADRLLLSGEEGTALFETAGARVWYRPGLRLQSAAFSADGRRLAAALPGGDMQVLDAASGEAVLALFEPLPDVLRMAFSPDGSRICAATWTGRVGLWSAEHGGPVWTTPVGGGQHTDLAYPTADRVLVLRSGTGRGARLIGIDAPTGRLVVQHWSQMVGAEALALSSDGATAALVSANEVEVRRLDGWTLLRRERRQVRRGWGQLRARVDDTAVYFADGRWLDRIRIDGSEQPVRSGSHRAPIASIIVSPDGRHLVSAAQNGTVVSEDLDTGRSATIGRNIHIIAGPIAPPVLVGYAAWLWLWLGAERRRQRREMQAQSEDDPPTARDRAADARPDHGVPLVAIAATYFLLMGLAFVVSSLERSYGHHSYPPNAALFLPACPISLAAAGLFLRALLGMGRFGRLHTSLALLLTLGAILFTMLYP